MSGSMLGGGGVRELLSGGFCQLTRDLLEWFTFTNGVATEVTVEKLAEHPHLIWYCLSENSNYLIIADLQYYVN